MSPKKKPPSLHALCMKFLSNQLIQVLSDEEGKYLDQVEAYMYSATYDTLQALLNEILGMINLDASTRFSCLQVLLREDVRYLEVGIFPRFYYDKILGDSTELLKFLETSGHRLQVLKLNHSKTSSTDLAELCEFTPSLNTLECYLVYLKYTNPQAFMMSLQNVDILYCDIDDSVVKTLLTNAPFLKSVRVGSSLGMTDGDMFRLLGECTLENLEELVFTEARFLTAVTVQLLAENCPKLRILGSLVNWDVTDEEIDALRVLVSMTNTDLTLWPET